MTGSDPGIAPERLYFSALLGPVNDRSLLREGGSDLAVRLVHRVQAGRDICGNCARMLHREPTTR